MPEGASPPMAHLPIPTSRQTYYYRWIPMALVCLYCVFCIPGAVFSMIDGQLNRPAVSTEPLAIHICVAINALFDTLIPWSLAGLLALTAIYTHLFGDQRSPRLMIWVLPILLLTLLLHVVPDLVLWWRDGYAWTDHHPAIPTSSGRVMSIVNSGYWAEVFLMATPLWSALVAVFMRRFGPSVARATKLSIEATMNGAA